MASRNSPRSVAADYAQIRTVPALLGILFAVASLFQFGGVTAPTFTWFDYTLSASHAMLISLGAYVVAFASSETKAFEYYEQWEQVLIAAGPVVILAHHFAPAVRSLVTDFDPFAGAVLFLLTIASWGVAVR
jgi:hypothetical protein